MAQAKLVVIDFDGTLMGRQDEYPAYAAFKSRMDELRAAHGTLWAVSTGRSPRSFWRRFAPMALAGIEPDYVVTHHAYISSRTPLGFRAHIFWNLRMFYLLWKGGSAIRFRLDDICSKVSLGVRGCHIVAKKPDRLCLRFDSQSACDVAMERLANGVAKDSHLMLFRYMTEIDIRSVPFTKGLAVSELARHLGIGSSDILAIGNGHNDISMFVPDVAAMTGCPANSEAEVVQSVHLAGGHIASKPSLAGTLEVIEAYSGGSVSSELPSWWRPPETRRNPMPARKGRRPWTRSQKFRLALFLAVVYVVIVVFANFGLFPFAEWIMLPFRRLMGVLEKLLENLL